MNADNMFASVGVIVLKNDMILLVRHTYGSAKGRLLIPGGFIKQGEMPFDAAVREVKEETGIIVKPYGVIGIRCEPKCWYMSIVAEYISGIPVTDNAENSEALFMNINDAFLDPTVTNTTKKLISLARENKMFVPSDTGKGRILFS